jgi:23S rRNA (guanosine2251-2'-O)-methyltransferase
MYNDQIVYGIHPVTELLKSRLSSIDHIYFEKEKKSGFLFEIMKICRKERLSYSQIPDTAMCQFAGTNHHQGVAALCSVLPYTPIETIRKSCSAKKDPLLILPASIEDPGNLGAIIRSSVALNADAILLERKHTAPLNASVAKSSAGMVEHIAVARPKNLEGVIIELKNEGFHIIGAEMKQGNQPQFIDFKGPIVLILGGEHRGIPPYLSKLCSTFTSIQMNEKAQSLNVSVTAAILLYEIARQRST